MRAFFIRILQVVWIISILVIAINLPVAIAYPEDAENILGASFGWLVFLTMVQYLVFASFNPGWAFGRNKDRYFILFLIISFFLAIVGGVGLKLYNKYEYSKKLEAGSDVEFFEDILRDTLRSYDLSECRFDNSTPTSTVNDVHAAVSRLENQGVKGFNVVVAIAKQDDHVGRSIRCLIDSDYEIQKLAERANIKY